MKVNGLTFGDEAPTSVTVTLSIAEAAAIAVVFGKLNGHAEVKLGLQAARIYGTLTGYVFNPYWEDGVEDVLCSHNINLATINEVP